VVVVLLMDLILAEAVDLDRADQTTVAVDLEQLIKVVTVEQHLETAQAVVAVQAA
jgi:hypothetical protein